MSHDSTPGLQVCRLIIHPLRSSAILPASVPLVTFISQTVGTLRISLLGPPSSSSRGFPFLPHTLLLPFYDSPICWWIRHRSDSVLMMYSHNTLSKCQSWWPCDVWGWRLSMPCGSNRTICHHGVLFMGALCGDTFPGKWGTVGNWAARWLWQQGGIQWDGQNACINPEVGRSARWASFAEPSVHSHAFIQMCQARHSSRCWGFK